LRICTTSENHRLISGNAIPLKKPGPKPRLLAKEKSHEPNGKPGFIRIDTVHQGDQDKQKSVYHINAVDEMTQFEVVCTVEKISEQLMCQHFSGHKVKQILAAFRSPLATNSYSSNEVVHGCKTPQCIRIYPA